MNISSELVEQIVAHARAEAPNECCGVVAVQAAPPDGPHDGAPARTARTHAPPAPARAVRVHRAVNTAASPLRFEIDGREVLGLIEAIERDDLELGAIYHSHTRTAPYPSQTDVNFAANWPGVEWIIVGLADPRAPEVRSYLIDDGGQVEEVAIAGSAIAARRGAQYDSVASTGDSDRG
jgi:[CysO sulfur-carrier protein]-S-L-cysteine hydrolase